jgi:RimJ/RimL family protein N-acetyltransferase
MILLEQENYTRLIEPLSQVRINNLFALSVLERHVTGKVYVDNKDNPSTYYIVHPYGISLLFGRCFNKDFNNSFRDYALNTSKVRDKYEWMQAYPDNWHAVLNELLQDRIVISAENYNDEAKDKIELNTRVNFKFNIAKYLDFKKENNRTDLKIVRTDKQLFNEMKGSVIPSYFWDSVEDFAAKGIGFSLLSNNELASTAYSAFILGDKLEIGIETVEKFRGKGFAQYSCSRLIDYCIDNKYEPIWSCKLENISSFKLAQKLGFEPTIKIPFYRLNK